MLGAVGGDVAEQLVGCTDVDGVAAALGGRPSGWHKRASKALTRHHRPQLEALLASTPAPLASLPSATITVGSTTVELFGIAHGQKRVMPPSGRLHELVREVGADGVEPGFSDLFRLSPSIDLDIDRDRMLRRAGMRSVLRLLFMVPVSLFTLPLSKLSRDPSIHLIRRAVRDPDWLPAAIEGHRLTNLPEPPAMEVRMLSSSSFIVAYSEAMADAIRVLAADGRPTLRIVVGAAHVPDLQALLAVPSRASAPVAS